MARRVLDLAHVRARMATVVVGLLSACAASPGDDAARPSANDGMFRDFVDGKFDGAGHPINARVTDGETLCASGVCEGRLQGTAQRGELVVNARVKVMEMGEGDEEVVTVMVKGEGEGEEVKATIGADRVRELGAWIDVPVTYWSDGAERTVSVLAGAGAEIEVAYVETFPPRFRMALSPGSGVIADDDVVTIELAKSDAIERIELDGADLDPTTLAFTRTETEFRTLYSIRAADLAPARGEVAQLRVHGGGEVARMELRRAPAPCTYEGDAGGTPVLVTGFQPFPADGWHENVAEVAVRNLRPSALDGVRVMRMVLPVEYDRAAAAVRDAIARCAPRAVVSFGQGGGSIALEQTAYNLKDTGEVAGGVPDNRGVIAAALPIDAAAPAERASSLPLAAIDRALRAIGESPVRSDDPGRYICNNVFFTSTGASSRAGFVHLPYTTQFDDAERARWGRVAEAIVQTLR
jgi:pyroglutamyl-peptidase